MIIEVKSLTSSSSENRPESPTTSLPWWDIKTIEVVRPDARNPSIGRLAHNQKQYGNVALMACVLETCDLNTYVDAQGVPKWENGMTTKIDSLQKNQTCELVPQPRKECHEMLMGL